MPEKKKVVKDSAYFARIGSMGGNTTKRRKLKEDPDYYSRIGLLGGRAMLDEYGKEFYSRIGKMSKRNDGSWEEGDE